MYDNDVQITVLLGKTIFQIENLGDEMIFHCTDGTGYKMYHRQECCESVAIDDIEGDINDLLNNPILQAECPSTDDLLPSPGSDESFTWTFYKLATIKGYVTIKWFGTSNGYYSESVDFISLQ